MGFASLSYLEKMCFKLHFVPRILKERNSTATLKCLQRSTLSTSQVTRPKNSQKWTKNGPNVRMYALQSLQKLTHALLENRCDL